MRKIFILLLLLSPIIIFANDASVKMKMDARCYTNFSTYDFKFHPQELYTVNISGSNLGMEWEKAMFLTNGNYKLYIANIDFLTDPNYYIGNRPSVWSDISENANELNILTDLQFFEKFLQGNNAYFVIKDKTEKYFKINYEDDLFQSANQQCISQLSKSKNEIIVINIVKILGILLLIFILIKAIISFSKSKTAQLKCSRHSHPDTQPFFNRTLSRN